MTSAGLEGAAGKEPNSEETVVVRRLETPEQKARYRFINKFFKKNRNEQQLNDELGNTRNRHPWYKGKLLKHQPFTFRNQLEATLGASWVNLLLVVAVPVGFALNYAHANPVAVFFVNFAAVLPMAGLLGYAMDELRLRTGDLLGALIYMSFGNIVQAITSIFLLRSRQISTLKTTLIGGILTLILLNNGVAFFVGGRRRTEQFYNNLTATVFSNLLSVSIVAFVIPTASFYLSGTTKHIITKQSRGTAIFLMIIYSFYLYFELKTHAEDFQKPTQKVAKRPKKNVLPPGATFKTLAGAGGMAAAPGRSTGDHQLWHDELIREDDFETQEPEEPQLQFYVCLSLLVIGTTILAFNTQFMTDSIQGLTEKAGVPRDFIGMILLPILNNDAMAIQCASRDQMDLALQPALGKSVQTALVVAPILVVVGWDIGLDDMNFLFDGFQVSALFVSVLLAQQCILDAKSNWLKGAILTMTYTMIAVASWFQGTESVAS